jgi:hypothetical protein
MDDVQRLAAKAAQVIEFHGHTKNRHVDDATGHVCLAGAIHHARFFSVHTKPQYDILARHSQNDSKVVKALMMRIRRIIPSTVTITGWNDEKERTADEVIHVLKRIANGEGM